MSGFYHACFVVPDLEKAMRDFTTATGTSWRPVRDGRLGDWDYRIVFSEGPPHLELIEGPPGSPWDCGGAARFDHLGWWTRSIEDASARLAASGFPAEFDACPYGRPFAYHRVDSIGARIELVDVAVQPGFLETWNPGGTPMRALEEN
ncbi:VOC family protein [Amycolatopsis samaneae]|uniref:VOC family protein n=1 Tax=Amycolatopsis samaneae TaxID=664691 RepID=A0ABW5G9B2_9PSEU